MLNLIHVMKCEIENLVVEGEVANIAQFPHSGFLNIQCTKPSEGGFICGSSIINQRIVLTAAHCVNTCASGHSVSVSVGHRNMYKGSVSSINYILTHPQYNNRIFHYDLALLRSRTALRFSYVVRRVALMKNPPYYEEAHVAGWGYIKVSCSSRLFNSVTFKKIRIFYCNSINVFRRFPRL